MAPSQVRCEAHAPQLALHQAEELHDTKNLPILSLSYFDECLATCSLDGNVHLWKVSITPKFKLSFCCKIEASTERKSLNTVRFSKCGRFLAVAGDKGELKVFFKKPSFASQRWTALVSELVSVTLSSRLMSRSSTDFYGMDFGSDSSKCHLAKRPQSSTVLCAGGVNGGLWAFELDLNSDGSLYCESLLQIENHHEQSVQGVSVSPGSSHVSTCSMDRSTKTLELCGAKNFVKCNKDPPLKGKCFVDDSMCSFFRRPSWSPNGGLLLVPSGIALLESEKTTVSQVFSSSDLSKPKAYVKCAGSGGSVGARFLPKEFEVVESKEFKKSKSKWTYGSSTRQVFAVSTMDSVSVHDTMSSKPLMVAKDFHYAEITDLEWMFVENRIVLACSSRDGYMSFFDFGEEPFGVERVEVVNEVVNEVVKEVVKEVAKEVAMEPVKAPVAAPTTSAARKRVTPTLLKEPSPKKPKRVTPILLAAAEAAE